MVRRVDIPLLLVVRRVLLAVVDYLALPGQRALYKGALLLVEIAQDAQLGALGYYAAAFASPAGITWPLSPRANVGDGADARGHRLAGDHGVFGWGRFRLLARAGSGDGDRIRPRHGHGGLYSHGGRHDCVLPGSC